MKKQKGEKKKKKGKRKKENNNKKKDEEEEEQKKKKQKTGFKAIEIKVLTLPSPHAQANHARAMNTPAGVVWGGREQPKFEGMFSLVQPLPSAPLRQSAHVTSLGKSLRAVHLPTDSIKLSMLR